MLSLSHFGPIQAQESKDIPASQRQTEDAPMPVAHRTYGARSREEALARLGLTDAKEEAGHP